MRYIIFFEHISFFINFYSTVLAENTHLYSSVINNFRISFSGALFFVEMEGSQDGSEEYRNEIDFPDRMNIHGDLEELHSSCMTKKSDDDGKRPLYTDLLTPFSRKYVFAENFFRSKIFWLNNLFLRKIIFGRKNIFDRKNNF